MKKIQSTWVYIIGILIFFGVLVLFAKDVFLPRIFNRFDSTQLNNIPGPSANYLKPNVDYIAKIITSEGEFNVDLLEFSAPKNVANFIYLSKNSYYNEVKFHRMVPNLLIQGGDRNTLNSDPNDDGLGKTNYFIEDEVNWENLNLTSERIKQLESLGYKSNKKLTSHALSKYTLAMANTGPNTNSSQFFIVLADDNDTRLNELNGQYTVIGVIVSGEDTLKEIATIPVDDSSSNAPKLTKEVKILSIQISNK